MPTTKKPFYSVIRQYLKGDKTTNNVMVYDNLKDAQKRYFANIAADIASDDILYSACYIVDNNGLMLEGRVFDNRPESAE